MLVGRLSVRFYSTLVPVTGQREMKWIIQGPEIPLINLLKELCDKYGDQFREQIFDQAGEILPPTRISVENEFLPGKDPDAIKAKKVLAGQSVKIFPPTDGG